MMVELKTRSRRAIVVHTGSSGNGRYPIERYGNADYKHGKRLR